jgi:cation diffusion facilitator CzcD-associated flavoprotein CzcO
MVRYRSHRLFEKVVVYDRRAAPGGLWNPSSPSQYLHEPEKTSPVYGGLETNLPKPIIEFSTQSYPPDTP